MGAISLDSSLRKAAPWAVFACVLLAVGTVGLPSPDVWWQLAGGRMMVARGIFPARDPFSFTAAGLPWLNHEWLAEAVMFLLYRDGGLALLHVARLLSLFATFYLMGDVARLQHRSNAVAAGACVVAVLNAQWQAFFDIRPYLFTYLLLAFTRWLIERFVRSGRTRTLAAIPPLFAAWANLHSGVIAGVALLAVAAVAAAGSPRRARALAVAAAVAAAATLLNPYGPSILELPFQFLHRHSLWSSHLNEWARPDLLGQQRGFLMYLICTLAGAFLLRSRLGIAELFMVASFGVLAVSGWRHLPLFAIISVPVWAAVLERIGEWLPAAWSPSARARRILTVLLLAGGAAAAVGIVLRTDFADLSREAELFPKNGVAFLEANTLPNRLFNPYGWGGYLLFHLWPRYRIFMDGRANTLYPESVYRDFLNVTGGTPGWNAILHTYGVGAVLVNDWETRRFAHTLGRVIPRSPSWVLVYTDPLCDVYLSRTAADAALLRAGREGRLHYPAPPPDMADVVDRAYFYLDELHAPGAARRLLRQVLRQDPRLAPAWLAMGTVAVREGHPRRAAELIRRALRIDPRLPDAHYNLGALLLARGDRKGAQRELERELEVNPHSERARRSLQQLTRSSTR